MATNTKEIEMEGDHSQTDLQQENYEQKFQEMQKYIPFLEMMIQRLERSSDNSREAQLLKMKSLRSLLSGTKKKLNIGMLKRCEDVLQKLHEKVEKGTNAQAKHAAVKPAEEKRAASKSQESVNPGGPDKVCSDDGNEQQVVTSSADDRSIMKTLKLAAARTSGKSISSATSCPAKNSGPDENRNAHATAGSCISNMPSSEKKSKALDVLEQSRERLKKLIEQQTLSTESAKKPDCHLGSPSMEWQYQTDPPWEKQDYEKGSPKSTNKTVIRDPEEGNSSRANPVKGMSSSEETQFDDEQWGNGDSSRSQLDGSHTEWSDCKLPIRAVWPPEGERHGNTFPNKPTLNQTGVTRVPASPHSPSGSLSQQAFATDGGMQPCSSPTKKSLPKLPIIYNVLKHPPAAGTKPLSDADIEELLEDTNKSESEPDKKEEFSHMSLRAKLEQEIQQVHRVGVSKGGALRSLVQKDDKLKSPVRNMLDMMKPNSEVKKDKLPVNRLQVSSKLDSVMGGALKANYEKSNDTSENRSNAESHITENSDNKTSLGNFKDMVTKSGIKEKRPTDPRRRASFSPRQEESSHISPWDDVHPAVGEKNDPRVRLSTDAESNYSNPSYSSRDLPHNDKLEGTTKKEGTGILSSLSKEELQKIVEDNLRNLPSPPPNTKEILETVHMNSPTTGKPVRQQPADYLSPLSSPTDYSQPGFVSPHHSSHYGSQSESHIGIARNSTSYNSFGILRPEDRRPLLPTPNMPHDPRVLPRNLSHDPRCSRDNQGPPNIHDPRLNASGYPHHDNYRSGILPHPPHDQFMRPFSNNYHQNPHSKFHSNQTHLQTNTRWVGTNYGVLPHNSARLPVESFMHPGDSYPQHGANNSRFLCSPHSSQHEFSQFPGQIRPLIDQFSGNRQQHLSWQTPTSSQVCFRSGSSANYPSSARSVGQPAQHHGNISHGVSKIPAGDPRLSNPQFSGHRPPVLPQGTSTLASVCGSGVNATVSRAQSIEGRSGNTLSERDPRRRSIEEPEKGDCNSRSNRDNRKISTSAGSSGPEQRTDQNGSNERRRDSDARKFESNSFNKRRNSPEPNKPKETELVSPLNSLYDVAAVPKTGKGYGFQKFRIPKIKRPPSPPKSKPTSPLKAKSPPPKLESSSSIIDDDKEKAEVTKSTDKVSVIQTETVQSSLKDDASSDVSGTDAAGDEKSNVGCMGSKKQENASAEKNCDEETEKISLESRSVEEVTQEWIEALIKKSFECGEGKKIIEQAKLLEKLGENLKGKKLRKIKRILDSDSGSESDESDFESSKKDEKNMKLEKDNQKVKEEGRVLKNVEVCVEQNKKSKCRRLILSDDDHSTDSETHASKLKKTGGVQVDNPLSAIKGNEEVEKGDESSKVEDIKSREKKQTTSSDKVKPTRKYSKRRSALELLQEDIREMFICEGVVTATGHRMCRLLKETPPGMTVDELSKSTVKITEEEVYTTAEESDASSVIFKKRSKKMGREEEYDKKGKEEKVYKKQKGKVKMKDEEIEYECETGCGDAHNELDESRTNSKAKNNKDGSLIDETGDSSGSPVTKPCKRYEKSRWKGYVLEESEDSAEEEVNANKSDKKKSLGEQSEVHSLYSRRGRRRSKAYPAKGSNSERGRRARLPRVMLEKADISKLNVVSSKPRTKYMEDSSSEESVVEDGTLSPVSNVKSKFKAAQKSKAKVRHAYQRRGRGGGVAKRGRKKNTKVERNDEFSTDVESVISDHSSIASTASHQTNLENTFTPIGFTFRRKCSNKRSKLLGKKIDDIIKRLTKDDGFRSTDVAVNTTNSEENLSESCRGDSSMEETIAEAVNAEMKEKENITKIDDTSVSMAATNKLNVPLTSSDVDTENTKAPNVGKKRNSRIMLNLVRRFGIQKKIKKKKAKWQLGIINYAKKKGSIKLKSEVEARDITGSVACEKEVNINNKAVTFTDLTDESNSIEKVGSDVCINEGKEKEDKLVSSKQIVVVHSDKLSENIELKHISETEDNKMLQMKEVSNLCAGKSDEALACLESKNEVVGEEKSVLDQSYVLDGSAKYACKLCLVQCKNIVSHYKNYHPESEVLISRLPVDEAARAISEALESNFVEVCSTESGKRKKKQAGKFICRICDHIATFALNFYEHLSSHTGEYRFRCGKCSYEASTKHSVKGHFYYHHPELRGIESVHATVLAPGPPNEAKFVSGYLCSSCNFVQLLKQNIEKHISLRHPSESNAKSICINMSKITTPNVIAEDESKNFYTDEGTKESFKYAPDNIPFDAESKNGEEVCNIVSPAVRTEMTTEEDMLGPIVTGINAVDKKPGAEHDDKAECCEAVVEGSIEKEQKSEIEPTEAGCETESAVSSCIVSYGKPDVMAVCEEPEISKDLPALDSDLDADVGDVKSGKTAVEMQLEQKSDGGRKNDTGNIVTTISESSTSETEEAAKEVDLKAFVCSDDLEEENSVIQKERLKKMQEIAKNLKDNHPKFLQSNRNSILDQLSDKLKTGFKSKAVDNKSETGFKSKAADTTLGDMKTVDSLTNSKDPGTKDGKSQIEKLADVSTLIDEKRAIEAAQAVQNLLRAEKETTDDKQSTGIGRKVVESPNGSRSGRHSKPCTGGTIERRITRSLSKNEDDVEVDIDESSSDISFLFEGEDNDDIAESESQSPGTLLNETLSVLKDVCPRKSASRMFDIIERLASKVVPKTEPSEVSDHMDIPECSRSMIAKKLNFDHSSKNSELETRDTDSLESVVNRKSPGIIGKPPPLISLGSKEKHMLRGAGAVGDEGSFSLVRVGPLEARRFSDRLLYSCCIRGCIFASTDRMAFANHIENTHKVSRWNGSCQACNKPAKGDQYVKLSHALHHLIKFHLVAPTNDHTTLSAMNSNDQDSSALSSEETSFGEGEASAENMSVRDTEMLTEETYVDVVDATPEKATVGGEEMPVKNMSVEQEVSKNDSPLGGGECSNSNEGGTDVCAPRKFIRLRRLSGDLLSIPKPMEGPITTGVQEQALRKDDMEISHLISEVPVEGVNEEEEDSGPFLRIESVVSLNPDAMKTEDVNEILKAVEDPLNTSKSPEKLDPGDHSDVKSPPTNIYAIPTSSNAMSSTGAMSTTVIPNSVPFMTTAPGPSTSVLRTSSPDVQLLTSSSPVPISLLRGKAPRPHGTMHMIPITPLSKSSTITILPSLQQLSPMKLNNVQLSPVKLTSFKSADIASKPSVATNIPHSLMGLAQITRPTNSKVTVAKEKLSSGMVGGGIWCNQVLPSILPKGTFVRLEIKDNQVTAQTPVVITSKSQAPVKVTMKTAPSMTMTTNTTSSVGKAPVSSVSVKKRLEVKVTVPSILQKVKSTSVLAPPPIPSMPASNTVLSTVVSKNKLPHKSAVAPSYAKASKVPSMYQEMIKPVKLRHLYKCMARLCSYTTDCVDSYSKHYNEHEKQQALITGLEKKKGRPPAAKMSDWQQCAYCCAIQNTLSGVVEHIQKEHGHCLYQCAYCFYRAVTKSYIVLHQNTSHTSEHVAVLMCRELTYLPQPVNAVKPRSSVIVPYVCEQGNCGAVFYIPESFLHHLEKEHSQLAIYSCHLCGSKSFKPDRLLAHYKLHSCCSYQCMYCLHGTDTKEEMHHHLCNFHSNQMAKVIIRATSNPEFATLGGKQSQEEILKALDVLDLDEGLSDDGLLILPPPEKEPAAEDPSLPMNVTCSELQELKSPSASNDNLNKSTGVIPEERALDEDTTNVVLASSSEQHRLSTELKGKESNKCDDTNITDVSSCVVGSDDKSLNSNSSACGSNQKADEDIVIIDDGVSHTQPLPQQDSDVEFVEESGNSRGEEQKLNETCDSDVIVLDSSAETLRHGTESVNKVLDKKENTNLVFQEPLVTVKHRNPKTTAAIAAAVDPLSFELPQNTGFPQNGGEAVSVAPSVQNKPTILHPATTTGLDSEAADCIISGTETSQNELSAAGMEDIDDTGLSGSMLYQCGYVTCTFSAEVSSLLKDHLLVCDLARASSSLTCVHCKKQFKYVNSLLEHLRTHGTRRFRCALCSFRAPVPQQVAKHLKQRHRVGSTRVIPLNPLRTDPETSMFIVLPKDKGKGGRGGKGSGKDTHDMRSKLVFHPEDVELLPRQAIYTRPVQCATCSYTTKVRSNMVRHLHLHLTSSIVPDVVPPENAPVNPVPCLEKKEMMFDKMTNLAASSHMPPNNKASETPSGSLTLTEELEEKLPKFVPEHQRYVCGAPECSYLTCDETMLRYHLRALHFNETSYRCPHCPASALQENMGQMVSIERMGAHLKMHDSRLYKCAHCMYHHFQRYVVERHLSDKHPEKRPFVHVVREPDVDSASVRTEASINTSLEGGNSSGAGALKNPWHCGLCKFQCSTRSEVLDHTSGIHGLKSQFKCSLCSYRSSSKASFDSHFASRHPAAENVELIHVYRKVDTSQTSQSPGAKSRSSMEVNLFDTTPLWRRDMQRVRHIRGILLEEEGDVPKPDIICRTSIDTGEMEEEEGKFGPYGKPIGGNLYFCPRCNKYRTKFKADFRDHLYRELSYNKWVCTHCSQMSCSRSTLQRHSIKFHEKDRKPEAIAPLTPNKEIEEWVEKVISTQLALMKVEQQTYSGEASSSNKMLGHSLATLAQPGPSGLSGRASKTEHSVPGSGVKVSLAEREDQAVTGSTSSDSDSGTTRRKMPGVRDSADNMKHSSKTVGSTIPLESVGYAKKASQDTVKLLRFPCKHCNMKFSLIRGLKVHIRHNHLKLSIWTCGHCGYVANSEESVLNHSKADHPDLPPRSLPHTKGSCVKLDDEFWQREYGLGQGSEYKYLNTPVTTPSSSASSSPSSSPLKKRQRTSSLLNESEENSTEMPSLVKQNCNKCLYCEYFCRSASDLKYHMRRHWVQKPYRCGYCIFGGVREYEVKKHSARIHPLKKLRVIEKPMPSEPDIRPLQRNKRSKRDTCQPTSNTSVTEIDHEKVMKSGDSEDVGIVSSEDKIEEEKQNTTALPNIFCCFYCPQRGTSVVSIHQHWQEKHKNKIMGSNGVMRLGLPFKYKEVNMKQFLKGQNGSAGRRPTFQCSYCKVRGTLSMLEAHQKSEHPDKPFRVSQAGFTRYECAECHFAAFTVNTLKRHFEMEHVGKELQYLVRPSKANFLLDSESKDSSVVGNCAASSGLSAPAAIVTAKYMCLWCQETCDSEDAIQVHHAMCHSHLQLKYSVEKSSTPTVIASNIGKSYSCPSCTFVCDSSQIMSNHVQDHAKPYKSGYCPRTEFPTNASNSGSLEHREEGCKEIHMENSEKKLENLRSDIGIRVGGESGVQRDLEDSVVPPPPKRLCVARKSTTLPPRIGKFHAVARKSTNPLLSQTAKKVNLVSCYDEEQAETSAPGSRSESPAVSLEFSYYGCRPAPIDANRITASVKLRNNLGVNMNMSLATMERFTNMYPVVQVKDLKYEKWALTH